jgi:hypothetical protein
MSGNSFRENFTVVTSGGTLSKICGLLRLFYVNPSLINSIELEVWPKAKYTLFTCSSPTGSAKVHMTLATLRLPGKSFRPFPQTIFDASRQVGQLTRNALI